MKHARKCRMDFIGLGAINCNDSSSMDGEGKTENKRKGITYVFEIISNNVSIIIINILSKTLTQATLFQSKFSKVFNAFS